MLLQSTKVIHGKQKHGEHLAEGAAHVPQPGKKTAREESHGSHKETDAEKPGGSVAESSESGAETSEEVSKVPLTESPYGQLALVSNLLRRRDHGCCT
jgi:hypothetical protein